MIGEAPRWQRELADAVRDPSELCRLLLLPESIASERAATVFSLLVPRGFSARMQPGDPLDPLLVQVLPQAVELEERSGFSIDPLGEAAGMETRSLLQKYCGRVLLLVTGVCAIHCRYCFRREFPYADVGAGVGFNEAIDAIAKDDSIEEVILSGGDPLSLSDDRLERIVDRIDSIGHVRRLRIHTRLPIVIPSRITEALLSLIARVRMRVIMVVHANHAAEIDCEVAAALERLRCAAVMLFNQSVLMRGVNDSHVILKQLSERLIDVGVTPYYLHLLDPVSGAAHYDVPHKEAVEMVNKLRDSMPGYAVPRLVREVPGESSKHWIH